MPKVNREQKRAYSLKFWNYLQKLPSKPQTKPELKTLHDNAFRATLSSSDIKCNFSSAMWALQEQKKITKKRNSDNLQYGKGRKMIAMDQSFVQRKNKAVPVVVDDDIIVEDLKSPSTKKQRVKRLVSGLLKNKNDYISDKQGVRVYSDQDEANGIINFSNLKESQNGVIDITVQNNSKTFIKIKRCEKLQRMACFTLFDKHGISLGRKKVVKLLEGKSYKVTASFSSGNIGIYKLPIVFEFESDTGKTFHVVRFLEQNVSSADVEFLKPTTPYHPPKPVTTVRDPEVVIDCGEPPALAYPKDQQLPLNKYFVPPPLRMQINQGPSNYKEDLKDLLEGTLSLSSGAKKLATLLFIEEMQMEVDIRRYDMTNVKMTKDGPYIVLEVPGLAENRPSVIKGDQLFVKISGEKKKIEYQGFVHFVEMNHVKLKFGAGFNAKFVKGMDFNVRFTFSRYPLRLMHRSIELGKKLFQEGTFSSLLMLVGDHLEPLRDPEDDLRLFDMKLKNNSQQYDAVRNIVAGTSRPAPYLVFGPPGTGKTVTIVEAMKQVLACSKETKILACAPSNSAADLILQRLAQHSVVPSTQMLRLNAYGRNKRTLQPDVLKYCYMEGDNFSCPTKSEVMSKYRVVVSTLVTAGRLVSAGVELTHFTHVFIDESGQAIEPEILVAIVGLFSTETPHGGQLVLAGDPKQLGPILRSPIAIKYGLNISMIERLMRDASFYQKILDDPDNEEAEYDSNMITKLLKNYRSHPDILKVPNEMFYDNELEVCADELTRNSLCQLKDILPKPGFPVVFHGVLGKDMREERSPSFFNPQEAAVVLKYVKKLREARGVKINTADIGIISPYRRQVQKIQQLLRRDSISDIKTGSVEEFQGQERRVIIISTVRSSQEYLHVDAEFKLGFLKNPKRFNVAITRAKALLIVVGNPFVLCADKHWKSFIKFCKSSGGYTGCEFSMPEEEEENLVEMFDKLSLDTDHFTVDNDDQKGINQTQIEGQAWRNFDQ